MHNDSLLVSRICKFIDYTVYKNSFGDKDAIVHEKNRLLLATGCGMLRAIVL